MIFVGRTQQVREFRHALDDLRHHHNGWGRLRLEVGNAFAPEEIPDTPEYPQVFVIHGIGGIGKTWLVQHCLGVEVHKRTQPHQVALLPAYFDLSIKNTGVSPTALVQNIALYMEKQGFGAEMQDLFAAIGSVRAVKEKVHSYRKDSNERWLECLKQAGALAVGQGAQIAAAMMGAPLADVAEEAMTNRAEATIEWAYRILVARMKSEKKLSEDEARLFHEGDSALGAILSRGLIRVSAVRPLIIALDTLESTSERAPGLIDFIQQELVFNTCTAPILWLLSGRHNIARERIVQQNGKRVVQQGLRDLLSHNQPVEWDISTFGEAETRELLKQKLSPREYDLYVTTPMVRRLAQLTAGVPLALELALDALKLLSHQEFLRVFDLDADRLLPAEKLQTIVERFLRYCLTHSAQDTERVRALALLRPDAAGTAIAAIWQLAPDEAAADVLSDMRSRYSFIRGNRLHEAVYKIIRRQMHTAQEMLDVRLQLGQRIDDHFEMAWAAEFSAFGHDSPESVVTYRRFQEATLCLLDALLWTNPERAFAFLLARLLEAIEFDRDYFLQLIQVMSEFEEDTALPLRSSIKEKLRLLRTQFANVGFFDPYILAQTPPPRQFEKLLDILAEAPPAKSLDSCVLNLWRGRFLLSSKRSAEALVALEQAIANLPPLSNQLRSEISTAIHLLGHKFEDNGDHLSALRCFVTACDLDRTPANLTCLGGSFSANGRHHEAIATYVECLAFTTKMPGSWHKLGHAYQEINELQKACEALENACRAEPTEISHYFCLGHAYERCHDFAKAKATYDRALRLEPESSEIWHALGHLYEMQRQVEQMRVAFQTAYRSERDNPRHLKCLGWGLLHCGIQAEAISILERAAHQYRSAEAYQDLAVACAEIGNWERAMQAARTVLELNPHDQKAITLCIMLLSKSDPTSALCEIESLLALNPQLVEVLIKRVELLLNLGHHAQAIEQIEALKSLNPNNPHCYELAGDALQTLERYAEALEQYDAALALDGQCATAWAKRGALRADLGRALEALADLERAIQIDPDYHWAYRMKAQTLFGLEQLDEALATFNQSLRVTPNCPACLAGRSGVHRALGNMELALADLDQAVVHDPNPTSSFLRGELLFALRQPARALEDFDRAHAMGYRSTALFELRGKVRLLLNQVQAAVDDLDLARQMGPEQVEILYWCGLARHAAEHFEAAATHLSGYLEAYPNHTEARHLRFLSYMWLGRLDAAFADLEQVIAGADEPAEYMEQKALLLVATHKYEEARALGAELQEAGGVGPEFSVLVEDFIRMAQAEK